jgi:hypothetical protein
MIWDFGRMLISVTIFVVALVVFVSAFVQDDFILLFSGPLIALVGFFVWPSAGVKSKTDPWSL